MPGRPVFCIRAGGLVFSPRHVALTVVPPLHAYEMIRAGLFGNKVQTFYDVAYLTAILASLTLLALWLARDLRRYVELE